MSWETVGHMLKIKRSKDGSILSEFDLSPEKARLLSAMLQEYAENAERKKATEMGLDRLRDLAKRLQGLSPFLYSQCFGVLDNKIPKQGCQDVLEAAVIVSAYADLMEKKVA